MLGVVVGGLSFDGCFKEGAVLGSNNVTSCCDVFLLFGKVCA